MTNKKYMVGFGVVIMLLLAAFFMGCIDDGGDGGDGDKTKLGPFLSGDDQPISGATVTVEKNTRADSSYTATTGSDGFAKFDKEIPEGDYSCKVEKGGEVVIPAFDLSIDDKGKADYDDGSEPPKSSMTLAEINEGGDGGDGERTLTVVGSTTVLPVAQAAADAWMADNPDDDIQVSGGGSSVGVKSVAEGTADIGMASRELKDSEKSDHPDLVQHIVAKDGIALIVHKDNSVTGLTLEQVRNIYDGTTTNWKDLGGSDLAIEVIGRDSASGTRATFEELVMEGNEVADTMKEKNSNGAVHTTITETPGAIGYVGLGYVDSEVKGLKIDGVEPTVANVQSGEYPISRNLNMFTTGTATGLVQDFIDFLQSTDGQAIVEDEGFVPLV